MKNRMITLLGTLVLAGAAHAAQPQPAEPQAAPAADAAQATQQDAKKRHSDDRNCLQYTGTRITHRSAAARDKATCSNNGRIGRVYTREDLDSTGRTDIADALRTLDPAIH